MKTPLAQQIDQITRVESTDTRIQLTRPSAEQIHVSVVLWLHPIQRLTTQGAEMQEFRQTHLTAASTAQVTPQSYACCRKTSSSDTITWLMCLQIALPVPVLSRCRRGGLEGTWLHTLLSSTLCAFSPRTV